MKTARPRICFVAPNLYPVLAGSREIQVVGGAEFQMSILARALARAGYGVTAITLDFGQGEETQIDGIRVLGAHRPAQGVPVLRYIHPRLTSFVRAMRRADTDIYYQRSASHLAAVVAWHAKRTGRHSVYAGASDTDFMRGQERMKYARDRWLFRWGLEHASAIVAQSERQSALVTQHYGREAVVIPNLYLPPSRTNERRRDLVLWVGGIRHVKRPDRFIAIARMLPQYRFRMIGGAVSNDPGARAYYDKVRADAATVPNLEFLGFLPVTDVEKHFDEAHVFVNTSEHEGFPNTFLQAWARGIPTVSFFDAGSDAFVKVPDESSAATAIHQFMTDASAWTALSSACRAHFAARHSIEGAVERFADLFERFGYA